MTLRLDRTLSDARWLQRLALLVGSGALLGSCDSNGPRTGKLSLTVTGIPESASAQVTLSGPNNFSRVLTRSDVVASLNNAPFSNGYVLHKDLVAIPDARWKETFNSDAAVYGGNNVGNGGGDIASSGGSLNLTIPAAGLLVFVRQ